MNFDKHEHEDIAKNIERAVQLVQHNTHRGGISRIAVCSDASGRIVSPAEEVIVTVFSSERLAYVRSECLKNPGKLLMVKAKL